MAKNFPIRNTAGSTALLLLIVNPGPLYIMIISCIIPPTPQGVSELSNLHRLIIVEPAGTGVPEEAGSTHPQL